MSFLNLLTNMSSWLMLSRTQSPILSVALLFGALLLMLFVTLNLAALPSLSLRKVFYSLILTIFIFALLVVLTPLLAF